jgi:hypothetical protein
VRFTFDLPDVIEIAILGESEEIKIEQVDRRPALENEFSLQERMFVKLDKELPSDFRAVFAQGRRLPLAVFEEKDHAVCRGRKAFRHSGPVRIPVEHTAKACGEV